MMRTIYSVTSWFFTQLSGLVSYWPLILCLVWFFSPATPHLRWEYSYNDKYGKRIFYGCTYLGPGGFVERANLSSCPFIAVMPSAKRGV